MAVVLGVDPGSRETGLVLMDRLRILRAMTFRTESLSATPPDVPSIGELVFELDCLGMEADLIAVEGVVKPTGQIRKINPGALTPLAAVAGAVVAWAHIRHRPVVTVRPQSHGSSQYFAYPEELHDPRGACSRGNKCDQTCVAYGGKNRHLRSAYDVAIAGAKMHARTVT